MTEQLPFHFSLSCVGEGNGNPLQCSCLENPRDGGACWAAFYGVAQSRTRLKRLSSSSCIIGLKCSFIPCWLFVPSAPDKSSVYSSLKWTSCPLPLFSVIFVSFGHCCHHGTSHSVWCKQTLMHVYWMKEGTKEENMFPFLKKTIFILQINAFSSQY